MGSVAIVGAGPGGATLAYLLARNGVEVTLLERHRDFDREFRGEVLMPSGLEPFAQMGLWNAVDDVPHVKMSGAELYLNGVQKTRIDFDPDAFGPYAPRWISQPKLLEMLVGEARRHDRKPRAPRSRSLRGGLRSVPQRQHLSLAPPGHSSVVGTRLSLSPRGRAGGEPPDLPRRRGSERRRRDCLLVRRRGPRERPA